jgi:hypothetical protein
MSPLSFEVTITALAPAGLAAEARDALQALLDEARNAALAVLARADWVDPQDFPSDQEN